MLHSSGSMQHDIMVSCKAGINNNNIRGALIEVMHAQQYAARCHALQVKKLLPPSPPKTYIYYNVIMYIIPSFYSKSEITVVPALLIICQ